MKARLAEAAQERLATSAAEEAPLSEAEVLRVLARIARRGRAGDRLRAAELIGKHLGMFREKAAGEGMSLADLVPESGRRRQLPAVTIEVVDPYAQLPEAGHEEPQQ